jgi:uncharacterized membrane protein
LSIFEHAWNYQIILTDNQHITVSNIIIAVIALIIGLKFARYLSKAFKKQTREKKRKKFLSKLVSA